MVSHMAPIIFPYGARIETVWIPSNGHGNVGRISSSALHAYFIDADLASGTVHLQSLQLELRPGVRLGG